MWLHKRLKENCDHLLFFYNVSVPPKGTQFKVHCIKIQRKGFVK